MLVAIGGARPPWPRRCGCGAALAGALFGTGWPRVGVRTSCSAVLVRLPVAAVGSGRRVAADRPRAAARHRRASTRALALLAAGSAGAGRDRAGAAARRLVSPPATAAPGGPRAARAAPAPRDALARSRRRGALALGRHRGRLLYAEHRHALVAFGPPQSGKSAGLAIPALLEWDGPAVATSIKTDLLAATIARRRALGEVFVFDPFGLSGVHAHTWSPLHGAHTWDGALEVAWRLAGGRRARPARRRGRRLLGGRRRAAARAAAVRRRGQRAPAWTRSFAWAYGQGTRELDQALALSPATPDEHDAPTPTPRTTRSARSRHRPTGRGRRSRRPPRRCCAPTGSGASPARRGRARSPPTGCSTSRATLYLIGDAKASKLLRPIFLALLGEVVDRAYERATLAGGRSSGRCCCASTRRATSRRCRTWPRSPRPRRATTSSSSRSSTTSPRRAAATASRPRPSSTATGRGCCCRASPTSRRCATSPDWSARRRPATGRTRRAPAGRRARPSRRRRPLIAAEALRQLPDRHALLLYGRLAAGADPPAAVVRGPATAKAGGRA